MFECFEAKHHVMFMVRLTLEIEVQVELMTLVKRGGGFKSDLQRLMSNICRHVCAFVVGDAWFS